MGLSLPAGLSATILATLFLILAAALAVFSLLTRRATVQRHQLALTHWAAAHGARVAKRPLPKEALSRLELLSSFHTRASAVIQSEHWTLAELTSDAPPEAKGKTPRWRVLAFELPAHGQCPPTGLRPVSHVVSLLDLLRMSSFPSLTAGDRFVLFGTDPSAAAKLAESPAQTLLPPDVGLLLHGRTMVLDFSGRPFAPTEFDRLLAIAAQLSPAVLVTGGKSTE